MPVWQEAGYARKVSLSLPAVTERLRKLTRSGIIDKYTIKIKPENFPLHLTALSMYGSTITKNASVKDQKIMQWMKYWNVIICGDSDLLLKVLVRTRGTGKLLVHKIKA